MMTEEGAHCTQQEMNRRALGTCFIGNFHLAPPPIPQLALGLRLTRALMQVFGIPTGRVYGHRELASYKSCPGRQFDLQQFRTDLQMRKWGVRSVLRKGAFGLNPGCIP